MILPDHMKEMPSGVMVILDEGKWKMSLNRVVNRVLNEELYADLLSQTKEFLREAEAHGHELICGADDDEAIRENLPKIGDKIPQLESLVRELDGGLEEAAQILPHLWEWIVGIADEPWTPDQG